ncbi:LysR family transcriptional regulator [Ramlibacter sp. WS9]|uniref:LysR family transcriptional regulator n=1 Tax=Ramlibacter sp. WS9 TaxID=1882741 RepID=UPI001141464A|nr:LysR family transcriptional regulator [Ramlibacter sp. WS9]
MATVPRSIGRRLRFSQLEFVHEVADCGNLGEAALRLHISRAAVSKSIKELERSLGQVLFERSSKGMVPTAMGLRVAKHARLLVNELRHLTDEVAANAEAAPGPLRIGMAAFVAEHVAPPILRRLADRMAPVPASIQLHEGRLVALIEQLLRGEIDAAMALYAPRAVDALDLSMLSIRTCAVVPMIVVAAPALGIAARRHRWPDLLTHPWILPPASTHQRRSVDEMFTARGDRAPRTVIESASLVANVRLASAGLGLAVVPLQAAQSEIAAGRLQVIDVRPALPQTTVVLMYRKVTAIYMDTIQMLDDAAAAEG